MSDNFSHQTNTGKTVNVVGDHTVVQVVDGPHTFAESIQPDIRRLFVSLKERYQNLYEQKLDGRFEITLEVSESFDSQNPQKIIERYAKDAKISEAFRTINNAFERKGRLLIVGNPGVGKTVLLLKLALNLLNRTDIDKQEAFPVIFNLSSWSDECDSFGDWLIKRLVSGYGLSRTFAATLLHQGRIIFLLDGLDELARNRTDEAAHWERARCLASLNDYLRRGRRAVVCCRREEFIQMQNQTGQDAPVAAKLEVLDLTKDDITLALLDAQKDKANRASANNLLKVIETNELFLEVLSTPFYFTAALEVFDKELWAEQDCPGNIKEIKTYLLNKFVENKLRHSPNPHSFQSAKATVWLKWLAVRLDEHSSTLFELSDLHLVDLEKVSIWTMSWWGIHWLNLILFNILVTSLEGSYRTLGISIYVIVWLTFDRSLRNYIIETEDTISIDLRRFLDWNFWKELFPAIIAASLFGLSISLLCGVFNFVVSSITGFFFDWKSAKAIALSFIPTGMIVGALSGVFIIGFEELRVIKSFASLEYPYQRLLGGCSSKLFLSILVILLFLIGMRLYEPHLRNTYPYLYPNYEIYLVLILFPLFFTISTLVSLPLIRHLILRVDLYKENKMPFKYATFLDYAVSLRILEKDGGHWRFRHQNLQEHFATIDNLIE